MNRGLSGGARGRDIHLIVGAMALAACAAPASAFFFATRFVERIGNTDVVLGDETSWQAGSTHRLRMQFGVFDDADGPAPSGGWAGWNSGTFDADFGTWTRTPGRLAPFAFAPFPYSNGVPEADPFVSLEMIDNVIGIQTPTWRCGPDGNPLPPPSPIIYGRNTFVSTFEATVEIPDALEGTFMVTIGGHWVSLATWDFHPELSTPPDCETGEPGVAFYAAQPGNFPENQGEFTSDLAVRVVVPAPASVLVFLAPALAAWSRRERGLRFREHSAARAPR